MILFIDTSGMKRILSKSKLSETLGLAVKGPEMSQFGLLNLNYPGLIAEHYGRGCVQKMLNVIDFFYPEIHIVTFLEDSSAVNRYEKENAAYYMLFRGDADPNLEFVYDEAARRVTIETWQFVMEVMRGEHAELFEDVDLDDL